ncbi:MAG: chorismate synthase [Bacteroidia bacterium]|nr:chorismate synthase [Bacteroidia bacterium]MCZ2277631.1 chorismate synthase [Bacteroidia bacterium]
MAGNSFGTIFRITTFGESHGPALGVIIDGCPAGLSLDFDFVQSELNKRKPGSSPISSPRKEKDSVQFLSGIFEGKTTGAPIAALVFNHDSKPEDYQNLKTIFRPSHADYTYQIKYGIRDYRGGGRASARETISRVIAGAIAKQILAQHQIIVAGFVQQVGTIGTQSEFTMEQIQSAWNNSVHCPDLKTAEQMHLLIEAARDDGDSLGGIIAVQIKGCPPGLGQPVFDKLQADLAKAMLSIPSVHGFEYGSGFEGALKRGTEQNDAFMTTETGEVITQTNFSGGIQGGISNGMDITFRVAFKPVSSIKKQQNTINQDHDAVKFEISGRHDPCVLPRAVIVVEAMSAIVLADHLLQMQSDKLHD